MSLFTRFVAAALVGSAFAATPAYASDVAGKWNIVAATQMGEFKATMTVAEADGAFTVAIEDIPPEGGAGGGGDLGAMESTISDVAVNGQELSFTRSLTGAFAMVLSYKLTVDGDTMTGEAGSDFGPTPITGTRAE
jgi:hypothetical protein